MPSGAAAADCRRRIISEIHPTDHKTITARNFRDERLREADIESVESEEDNKLVEAEFSRVYEWNKQQDRVHHVQRFGAWIQ